MSDEPLVAQGRKEYKDDQLLARLIGGAVLLAIAVIVLPFVLDGAGSQREYEYAETLPLQPPRPVVEKSYSSRQPLPEAPRIEDLPEVTTAAPPVLTAAEVAVEPVQVATEQGANPVVQPVTNVEPDSTRTAVVPLANQEIQPGFNIQVASFIKDVNALKLLKNLRAENLPAYVNRVDGKKRAIFRVFVGPIISQIDALALKNRIDRTYRVESIMVTRN